MDGGAELLSPAEADWPPELRLPPPPPSLRPKEEKDPPAPAPLHHPPPHLRPKEEPSPPHHAEGFDDQQFLGSIMGPAAQQPHQQPAAAPAAAPEAPVKRKRGRPPKNRNGAAPAPIKPPPPAKKKKDEEIVCFICFDGGNLVVCDRRGCPKVYHPACIKRDESFFRAKGKWDCGWHICSICEKAAHYMCYTCTYSLCKGCISQGNFFGVRGNKGFCDTCYGTIMLIESKDDGHSTIRVDFDDKNSWEYLFKLYWLDLKGKHLLTLQELIGAKSNWTFPTAAGRREKEESSDESYDANNDQGDSFDLSSRKRRQNNSLGKRGRKHQKDVGVTEMKHEISKGSESLPNRLPTEGTVLHGDTKWASLELLEFVGHMRNGDSSCISQYDVQVLLLEYIKQNNLRDPRKKSQIICDTRLSNLFRKPRVAHFEMLKLLEMHFHVKDNPSVNVDSHPDLAQFGPDKRRKINKKIERELIVNPDDYAAIDMHNINLIYLRRSLMEDLIDDNAAFSDKIAGAFVRIRICGLGQKQDMYRLVKVLGTHKVLEQYNVGKKTTNHALEILNLDRKEVITMDTISNQDFTEEECKRLRQSMKFGLVARLKVGDIYEKAKIFQSLQFNDWLENEKQRLSHLRDRASETGRRKQLRECVEKLQLLDTPAERERRINEVPVVHVDPRMDPDYESAEEQYYKKAADWTINRSGSDILFPERKGVRSNSVEHRTQNALNANGHMGCPPIENMAYRSGEVIDLNHTTVYTESIPSSEAALSDTEPEKVWHYKDPSGNVQGPFTLLQLSKWASYFPRDLRIWLTFESENNSLLLSEVLLKQQKDSVLPSTATAGDNSIGTGTGQYYSYVANNSSSPIGYNVVHSSELSGHSAEFSDPTKEGSTVHCGTLLPRSLKDSQNLHGQVQVENQADYSSTTVSSTTLGSRIERVPREWNNRQDIGGMWSPTVSLMNHSFKSNAEPHGHPDGYTKEDQMQNGSKGVLPVGSIETSDSQTDSDLQKVSVLTESDRDPTSSLTPRSPSEFICKAEDTCWRSAANAGTHDNLQLSISLVKPEDCSPTNPVEDRDSSSASGVHNELQVTVCLMQQVLSMSTTSSSKSLTINGHNVSLTDHECDYPSPTPKLEREQPSMNQYGSTSITPKDLGAKACVHSSISSVSESSGRPAGKTDCLQSLNQTSCLEGYLSDRDTASEKEQLNEQNMAIERKNTVGNPISDTEGIAVSDVLESLTEKSCEKIDVLRARSLENSLPVSTEEEQPQCSSPIALSPWGEQNYYQGEAVDSALWGVQDDLTSDIWSMPSPTPALQSSSDIKAVGKDVSHIIEEAAAARQCGILKQGEVKAKSSAASDPSLNVSRKSADWQSSGSSAKDSAKASGWKPPGLLLKGISKASDWQPSGPSVEGGLEGCQPSESEIFKEGGPKASSWQPSYSSPGVGTVASGLQQSNSSAEWGTKASGLPRSSSSPDGSRKGSCWRRSSSIEGSAEASGQKQSSASLEGRKKGSGCQRFGSSAQGNTNASGRQPEGSGGRSAKFDAWQQKCLSPEGSRKFSGWHSSVRGSSKVNSTSGANENHKWSSSRQATTPTGNNSWESPKRQENGEKNNVVWGAALGNNRSWYPSSNSGSQGSQTPTAKSSWEAPKRQENGDKNNVVWGEALGNNKSWYPSSDNGSQGGQGRRNHDRYSHSSDSRRGSSNHSRRSDHRQDHDYRRDHGRDRSRSLSRGHSPRGRSPRGHSPRRSPRGHSPRGRSPRGVCKYHAKGYCFKGTGCQYLHR